MCPAEGAERESDAEGSRRSLLRLHLKQVPENQISLVIAEGGLRIYSSFEPLAYVHDRSGERAAQLVEVGASDSAALKRAEAGIVLADLLGVRRMRLVDPLQLATAKEADGRNNQCGDRFRDVLRKPLFHITHATAAKGP